ncbi:hypothetical protein FJT64_011504 [Amphibalanus amphitrite]|uniref:Uncharacterized protein n=1 Tax=Amphibalanus amphitrite TaxID=1232801 RepID=A0A6A4VG73_AMPAM|nr:hypothetical protein FJT64_011504 [Amphibalanus amphitrite]
MAVLVTAGGPAGGPGTPRWWRLALLLRWLLVVVLLSLLVTNFSQQVSLMRRENTVMSVSREPRGPPPAISLCMVAATPRGPLADALPASTRRSYRLAGSGPFQVPLEAWRDYNWSGRPLESLWDLATPPLHQLVSFCNVHECLATEKSFATPTGTWHRHLLTDGVCFTLRANSSLQKQPKVYRLAEQGPVMVVNTSAVSEPIILVIPGNETLPRDGMFEMPQQMVTLEPGSGYDIRFTETRYELVSTHRSPCRPGAYHQLWCQAQCAWSAATAAAGCRMPWMVLPEPLPVCSDFPSMERTMRALDAGPTTRDCRQSCPPACEYTKYDMSVQRIPFPDSRRLSGVRTGLGAHGAPADGAAHPQLAGAVH